MRPRTTCVGITSSSCSSTRFTSATPRSSSMARATRSRASSCSSSARVTEGLTVQGSGSWNSSNQIHFALPDQQPADGHQPDAAGRLHHADQQRALHEPVRLADSRPAFSPPFEFNVRARYDFHVAEYKPFVSVGANYIGAMNNQPANYPSGLSPSQNPPTTTLRFVPHSRVHDLRCGHRCDQGQLDGADHGQQPVEFGCCTGHLVRAVHRIGDSAATASNHLPGRHEVLISAGGLVRAKFVA